MNNAYAPPGVLAQSAAAFAGNHHQQPHQQPAHHTFSPAHRALLDRAGKRAKRWGWTSLVLGVLGLGVLAVAFAIAGSMLDSAKVEVLSSAWKPLAAMVIPIAVLHLGISVFYIRAGSALDTLRTRHDQDMPAVLSALGRFRLAFQVEAILGGLTLLNAGLSFAARMLPMGP